MATIEKRESKDGTFAYYVKIRRKGHPVQHAAFKRTLAFLPADIFVLADELRSLYKGIRAEIIAQQSIFNTRDSPCGTGDWNSNPYMTADERVQVNESLDLLRRSVGLSEGTTGNGKRLKQYGRGEKGIDGGLQALAEAKAEELRKGDVKGNGLSKRAVANLIAKEKGFDPATVQRVIRLTWKK